MSAPRLFMVMEWCSLPLDALLQKRDATPVANLPDPSDRNWVCFYALHLQHFINCPTSLRDSLSDAVVDVGCLVWGNRRFCCGMDARARRRASRLETKQYFASGKETAAFRPLRSIVRARLCVVTLLCSKSHRLLVNTTELERTLMIQCLSGCLAAGI